MTIYRDIRMRLTRLIERILMIENIGWRMAVDEVFQTKHKVNEREQL